MNDTQILTLAISICVPLTLLILGNSRITDVKEGLRAEIKLTESKLEARMDRLEQKLDSKLDTILRILAEHETRLPK